MPALLLVDPDDDRRQSLSRGLEALGFTVSVHPPGDPPKASVLRGVDLVLVALQDDTGGLVERFRRTDPLVSVVVFSPKKPDPPLLATLGRARVYDCLRMESVDQLEELAPRLAAAARRHAIRQQDLSVAQQLLGSSPKIAQVRRYIDRAAKSEANVLVTGESGTGKELIARAVHHHGSRDGGSFIAVNCSAIPDTLLESELFGHEKGSFTGAVARKTGRFEQADKGTLFLDEVGDMPLTLQAKLLRVLQPPPGEAETTREYSSVGSEGASQSDVRMIFATHRDLVHEVKESRFREDLYQRINVLMIHVPPLRERRQDIRQLAEHFLERYSELEGHDGLQFDPVVLDVLESYDFPLNVRELEALVRSLVILKEAGSTVVLGDLPPHLFGGEPVRPSSQPRRLATLAEVEREHVLRVLDHANSNKSMAARILGVSRPALDRKLERYATEVSEADAS